MRESAAAVAARETELREVRRELERVRADLQARFEQVGKWDTETKSKPRGHLHDPTMSFDPPPAGWRTEIYQSLNGKGCTTLRNGSTLFFYGFLCIHSNSLFFYGFAVLPPHFNGTEKDPGFIFFDPTQICCLIPPSIFTPGWLPCSLPLSEELSQLRAQLRESQQEPTPRPGQGQ